MKYATFVYGTGVVYGATVVFTDVLADTGPSTGGENIVIRGEGFDYTAFDDEFTGVVLDGTKWNDISAGTGSIATGANHLELTTGATAGGVAGVSMKTTFANTQYECKVNIPAPTILPASEVDLFEMLLYADALNSSDIRVALAADGSVSLIVEIYNAGSVVESYTMDWTVGVSTFKILNWMDDTYFYANGILVTKTNRMIRAADTWYFFANNKAANYDIDGVRVEYVKCRPYIVLENQVISDATVVSDYRIRGVTPPSVDVRGNLEAYAGLVDVTVVAGSTHTMVDGYEYYYVDELTALNESSISTKLSIIGDDTLRTPTNSTRGLGGGK